MVPPPSSEGLDKRSTAPAKPASLRAEPLSSMMDVLSPILEHHDHDNDRKHDNPGNDTPPRLPSPISPDDATPATTTAATATTSKPGDGRVPPEVSQVAPPAPVPDPAAETNTDVENFFCLMRPDVDLGPIISGPGASQASVPASHLGSSNSAKPPLAWTSFKRAPTAPVEPPHTTGRLCVFYDFWPTDMAKADSLGVDPAFTQAQRERRAYRPRVVSSFGADGQWSGKCSFAYLDYPEVVSTASTGTSLNTNTATTSAGTRMTGAYDAPPAPRGSGRSTGPKTRLLPRDDPSCAHKTHGLPRVCKISDRREAIVMCRAGLWASKDAIVLQLDKASCGQQQRHHSPETPRRQPSITIAKAGGSGGGGGDPSRDASKVRDGSDGRTLLYAELHEWLNQHAPNIDYQGILNILAELVYDRWLKLFDFLDAESFPGSGGAGSVWPPPQRSATAPIRDITSAYGMCQRALETNVEAFACMQARGMPMPQSTAAADWNMLLRKIKRRIALQQLAVKCAPQQQQQQQQHHQQLYAYTQVPIDGPRWAGKSRSSLAGSQLQLSRMAELGPGGLGGGAETLDSEKRDAKERERSVDRVTYLGGIVLPFTVVSGLFSMSDDFRPGQKLFWVFWAVSIPLVLAALLLIYADTIRRADLWVPDPDYIHHLHKHGEADNSKVSNNNSNNNSNSNNNTTTTNVHVGDKESTGAADSSASSAVGFAPPHRAGTFPVAKPATTTLPSLFNGKKPATIHGRTHSLYRGVPESVNNTDKATVNSNAPKKHTKKRRTHGTRRCGRRRPDTGEDSDSDFATSHVMSEEVAEPTEAVFAESEALSDENGDEMEAQCVDSGEDAADPNDSHNSTNNSNNNNNDIRMYAKVSPVVAYSRQSPAPSIMTLSSPVVYSSFGGGVVLPPRRPPLLSRLSAPAGQPPRPERTVTGFCTVPGTTTSENVGLNATTNSGGAGGTDQGSWQSDADLGSSYELPLVTADGQVMQPMQPISFQWPYVYGQQPWAVAMPPFDQQALQMPRRQDSDLRPGWKKKKLGWMGACKALMGVYVPSEDNDDAYEAKKRRVWREPPSGPERV